MRKMFLTVLVVFVIVLIIYFHLTTPNHSLAQYDSNLFDNKLFRCYDTDSNYYYSSLDKCEGLVNININSDNLKHLPISYYAKTNRMKDFFKKYKKIIDYNLHFLANGLYNNHRFSYELYRIHKGRFGFIFTPDGYYCYSVIIKDGRETIVYLTIESSNWVSITTFNNN
jgi:hypothetical protein